MDFKNCCFLSENAGTWFKAFVIGSERIRLGHYLTSHLIYVQSIFSLNLLAELALELFLERMFCVRD